MLPATPIVLLSNVPTCVEVPVLLTMREPGPEGVAERVAGDRHRRSPGRAAVAQRHAATAGRDAGVVVGEVAARDDEVADAAAAVVVVDEIGGRRGEGAGLNRRLERACRGERREQDAVVSVRRVVVADRVRGEGDPIEVAGAVGDVEVVGEAAADRVVADRRAPREVVEADARIVERRCRVRPVRAVDHALVEREAAHVAAVDRRSCWRRGSRSASATGRACP